MENIDYWVGIEDIPIWYVSRKGIINAVSIGKKCVDYFYYDNNGIYHHISVQYKALFS